MNTICKNCTNDHSLRLITINYGTNQTCTLCNKQDEHTISTDHKIFHKMVACLIRYHYSEWQYHTKLGGGDLESILEQENSLFTYNKSCSSDLINDFIMSFLDDIYDVENISIITAYGRDIYSHTPYNAVKNGDPDLIFYMIKELESKNHFLVQPKYEKMIKGIKEHLTAEIPKEAEFYRARVGATLSARNYYVEKNTQIDYFKPYENEKIGNPPIKFTGPGRINRHGVSYLYLASSINTAISEVRPHPGETISTGKFVAKKDLLIANLSTQFISESLMNEDGLSSLSLIATIANTLSKTGSPSDNSLYSVTQLISDIVRDLGFDGISFKSSVSDGTNYVIFDPSMFSWEEGSGNVHLIQNVTYSFEDSEVFNSEDRYDKTF